MQNEKVQPTQNPTQNEKVKPTELNSKYEEWLSDILKDNLLFSKDLASGYEEAYNLFLTQQNEMINAVLVSAYDKEGIYGYIREEFKAVFNIECSFTNKKILDTIIALSFEQFNAKKIKGKRDGVSPEIQILENHGTMLLDFDFRKWIIKDIDGRFTRATNGLIEYIPNILKGINKMISHNEKDKSSPKKYLIDGKVVTKTLLKDKIQQIESIEALNDLLTASIDAYNEAYNINIRLSKALKELDKEVLIEFLEGVSTEGLKELLKARNAVTPEVDAGA
jgi:hypothetical protein